MQLAAHWPPGLPLEFTAWIQAWVPDPLGPAGYTASDAIAASQL